MMKDTWRGLLRLAALTAILFAYALVGLRINLHRDEAVRLRRLALAAQSLARTACRLLNIRPRLTRTAAIAPGSLIVANHIGTPDILALAYFFPAFFVARADFAAWPLLGFMVRLGDTLFIDKSRRKSMVEIVEQMRARLERGVSVAVFPEGGASDGADVNPFRSLAFESAVQARCPVVPVAIRYHDGREPSIACWSGVSFAAHMWALLCHPRLDVSVEAQTPIPPGDDRAGLAAKSHASVRAAWRKLAAAPPVA